MRPIETLLSLANLLTFFVLAIPRLRTARRARYLAPVALPIAGVQVLAEGPRWQMIPAYALCGLFFLVWLQSGKSLSDARDCSRAKRLAPLLVTVLGGLALAVSAVLPIIFPVFRFPQPSGPYEIGTLTYHWVDDSRQEAFSTDPNARRELMVQIWYPAKKTASMQGNRV